MANWNCLNCGEGGSGDGTNHVCPKKLEQQIKDESAMALYEHEVAEKNRAIFLLGESQLELSFARNNVKEVRRSNKQLREQILELEQQLKKAGGA